MTSSILNDKETRRSFIYILKSSFPLLIYNLNIIIPITTSLKILGKFENNFIISYFGVAFSIYNLFYLQLNIGLPEIIGIKISKIIGSNDYYMTLKTLSKYLLILWFLLIVYTIIILNLNYLLQLLGFEIEFRTNIYYIWVSLIPCLFWSSFNRSIETYFITMDIVNPLSISLLISYLVQGFVMYICVYKYNFVVYSYGISKIIQELVILFINIYLFKKYSPISFPLSKFSELNSDFFKNVWYCWKIFSGLIGEMFGFELNIIILSWNKNPNEISIWVAFTNIAGIFYFSLYGISFNIRTIIGKEWGKNKPNIAKSLSMYYFKSVLFFTYILGIILLLFCEFISSLYLYSSADKLKLKVILKLYFLILFNEVIIPVIGTYLRLLNLEKYQIIPTVFIYPFLQIIFSLIWVFYFNLGALGCFLGFMLSTMTVCLTMLYSYLYKSNWENSCINNKNKKSNSFDFVD